MDEDKYIDYYDMEFNLLPYSLKGHDHIPVSLEKPDTLIKMIQIAKDLCSEFPFVRVDLYDAKGKIYISEMTFIPTGGFMSIEPRCVLKEWGDWLRLPTR